MLKFYSQRVRISRHLVLKSFSYIYIYSVSGTSVFSNVISFYLFISCRTAGEWTIYPWIHSNCNSLSDDDQLRPVSIPDIHPARY